MSEEAKNIWTEESMVKFMSFSFDIKAFLSHVSKSLNLDETLEFQHQNFNGLSNSNYLLTNSTSKYFLRIQSKDDDSGYFSSPEREFKILKLLQDNNLNMGPKVYLFDDSKTLIPKVWMIEECLSPWCCQ